MITKLSNSQPVAEVLRIHAGHANNNYYVRFFCNKKSSFQKIKKLMYKLKKHTNSNNRGYYNKKKENYVV